MTPFDTWIDICTGLFLVAWFGWLGAGMEAQNKETQ